MNMSFKPSVIALLCGVGAVAVAGTVLVKMGIFRGNSLRPHRLSLKRQRRLP